MSDLIPWWDEATRVEIREGATGNVAPSTATTLRRTCNATDFANLKEFGGATSTDIGDCWALNNFWMFLFFQEKKDLRKILFSQAYADKWATSGSLWVSSNATAFNTGTWSDAGGVTWTALGDSPGATSPNVLASEKLDIQAAAVRMQKTTNSGSTKYLVGTLWLWGDRAASLAGSPHRLEFWDDAGTAKVADNFFSMGDVALSSTTSKTFRIKNVSPSETASSITVNMPSTYRTPPTLDIGGGAGSSVSIASLAPGALSDVITLTCTVGGADPLSQNRVALLEVRAASWSA